MATITITKLTDGKVLFSDTREDHNSVLFPNTSLVEMEGGNILIWKNTERHPLDVSDILKIVDVDGNETTPTTLDALFLSLYNDIFTPVNTQTTASNGVPKEFTKQSGNGKVIFVQQGQLNKWQSRPQILNEHAKSNTEVQASVTSSVIAGQIFKASQDNINGIALTAESAAGVSLDGFESYANSAALQVEWVKGGANEALLETTIIKTGAKSMKLNGTTAADDWVDTIGATDYTDFTFSFDFFQDTTYSNLKFEFFIGDGTNTKTATIVVNDVDSWHHIDVSEASMVEDGGTTDVALITKIGFRVSDKAVGGSGYVDNLVATPLPGSFKVKLWDMGASIPVTAVTSIDDGTQYTELGDRGINGGSVVSEVTVQLEGGKKIYQLNSFVAGVALEIPSNTLLTVGNYHALTIHYVDTDINIYGADTSFSFQYYNNGYAFTAPDESTAITAVGEFSDLMFEIFSTQDVYVVSYFQRMISLAGVQSTPGANSSIIGHIEDAEMSIIESITTQTPTAASFDLSFELKPSLLPKGGKFEIALNDDHTDDVEIFGGAIRYLNEPPTVNG